MQCLSSPTREEINIAHRKHKWLDIGMPSLRNLRHISRGKVIIWCLMALSSVSLHLLYNSVVFSNLSAQEYNVFAASVGLVNGRALNWTLLTDLEATEPHQDNDTRKIDIVQDLKKVPEWQKLDTRDCIKAYGQDFVSAHGDLILILPTANATGTIFLVTEVLGGFNGNYDWMCSDQASCSTDAFLPEAANWTISWYEEVLVSKGSTEQLNNPVQYCLSQPVEEQCQVQISFVILSVVVACNATKALCMIFTIRRQKSQPLVTLGDAIESFLQDPDQTTGGMCLASKEVFGNRNDHIWLDSLHKTAWTASPMEWTARRRRWFSSASLKRWLICNIL